MGVLLYISILFVYLLFYIGMGFLIREIYKGLGQDILGQPYKIAKARATLASVIWPVSLPVIIVICLLSGIAAVCRSLKESWKIVFGGEK